MYHQLKYNSNLQTKHKQKTEQNTLRAYKEKTYKTICHGTIWL